jgi:hypothetical protein
MNILGTDQATIRWHFLPPLYFSHLSNAWWGCCLPPHKGFTLQLRAEATSEWHFFLGLPRRNPETISVWTPATLGIHNFLLIIQIGMTSQAIF